MCSGKVCGTPYKLRVVVFHQKGKEDLVFPVFVPSPPFMLRFLLQNPSRRGFVTSRMAGRRDRRFASFSCSSGTVVDSFHILQTDSNEPYFNLAFEEWYYSQFPATGKQALFLWQNQPCVIIGRFQNPHRECNLALMEQVCIA